MICPSLYILEDPCALTSHPLENFRFSGSVFYTPGSYMTVGTVQPRQTPCNQLSQTTYIHGIY